MLDGLPDPQPFPAWMSDADIQYLADEFRQSGLRGPLNRYRNWDRDIAFLTPVVDMASSSPPFSSAARATSC